MKIIITTLFGLETPTREDLEAAGYKRSSLGVVYATEALLGMDDFCMEYIGAFRDERIAATNKKKA